jgi:hypothetical protein
VVGVNDRKYNSPPYVPLNQNDTEGSQTNNCLREEPHSQSTLKGGVSWELTRNLWECNCTRFFSRLRQKRCSRQTRVHFSRSDVLRASGISTNYKMQTHPISNSRRTDSETNPVFAGQLYQQTGWNNTPLFRNRVPCSTKPQGGGAKKQVEQVEQGNYVSANKETNCILCSRDEGNVFTLFQLFRGGRRRSRDAIIWNRVPCSTLFHPTPFGEVTAW